MAKQIEKRYMKFEDFLDKYAWLGDARHKLYNNHKAKGQLNMTKFNYVIRDLYTHQDIELQEIPEIAREIVKDMNKAEFAHVKKIYDLCFVKYKK